MSLYKDLFSLYIVLTLSIVFLCFSAISYSYGFKRSETIMRNELVMKGIAEYYVDKDSQLAWRLLVDKKAEK